MLSGVCIIRFHCFVQEWWGVRCLGKLVYYSSVISSVLVYSGMYLVSARYKYQFNNVRLVEGLMLS